MHFRPPLTFKSANVETHMQTGVLCPSPSEYVCVCRGLFFPSSLLMPSMHAKVSSSFYAIRGIKLAQIGR